MSEFLESMANDKQCPKCGNVVIFVPGGGWDRDIEYCSKCDYEVEYDTSSYIDE